MRSMKPHRQVRSTGRKATGPGLGGTPTSCIGISKTIFRCPACPFYCFQLEQVIRVCYNMSGNDSTNSNLNPSILSAIRNFYRMLLNPPNPLKTQGFEQVNKSIPVIRFRPHLRVSRELAREKSREDIGFWNVKDKASVGCRDVTSQQTCTLYQPKTSYKTGKRTSEDARFFILWR